MNLTTKALMTVFFAAGLGLAAASVQAFHPGGPGSAGEGPDAISPGPSPIAVLDLSKNQIKKLKTERLKKQKQMIKWQAEAKTLHLDIKSESQQDQPNLAQVEKLAGQIGELHGKMTASRVKSVIYLRSVLTPEQKVKMDKMQLDFGRPGFHGRKGRHGKRHK